MICSLEGSARGSAQAGLLRRATITLGPLSFILLLAQPAGQAQGALEALPFSNSYSITGNYVVGGVDLAPQSGANGFVTGTIPMSGVPANADILAAFLYWETIWTDDRRKSTAHSSEVQPITAVKASELALDSQLRSRAGARAAAQVRRTR